MPGVFNGVPGQWCGHDICGKEWALGQNIFFKAFSPQQRSFNSIGTCVFFKQPLSSALVQKAETAPDCEVMCPLRKRSGIFVLQQKSQSPPQLPSFGLPMSIHKYPWYIHDQVWNRLAADCPGLSSKIRPLPSYIFRKATSPPHQFPLRTMTLRGVQASNAGAAKVESAASRSEYHWISALDRQFFGTWTVERCLRTLICCSLQRNRLAAHRQQRTTESMRGLCGLLRIRPWRVGCLEWGSHEGDLMAA